jgi:hypothetical protein
MTVLNDIWRFLVQRKLWPVAVLLVAAAAAVPTLLSKDPVAPAVPAVAAVKSDESTLTTQPIVALASNGDRSERRRVLGSQKDPFTPNATPTPTPTPASSPTTSGDTNTPGGGASAPVTAPGSVTPGFTTPLAPVTPKKTYELFELTVRFGDATSDTQPPRRDVKRLRALPSAEEPVLIYLGVLKDNKTVVFMVDSGVVAQGDGTCRPSRTVCETIQLKQGETEFFDVPVEPTDGSETTAAPESTSSVQYQLDVIKIRKTTTSSAKTASKSIARVSKSGRKILRARIMGDGPIRYRYNHSTGRLEKLSHKAYKAAVANAARVARAGF